MFTTSVQKTFDDTALSMRIPDLSDCLLFDIETTGFKGNYSQVYLIGYAVKTGDRWTVSQLFADSPGEEAAILLTFAQILRPYHTVATFNGEQFDIPYLERKYAAYHLPSPFTSLTSVDLYRDLRLLRPLLRLSHMNQKSLEVYLGLDREDTYDGGALIQVYRDYIKTGDTTLRGLTLLHNFEDVCGMFTVTALYSYLQLTREMPSTLSAALLVREEDVSGNPSALSLDMTYPFQMPRPVTCRRDYCELNIEGNRLEILTDIYNGTALYFFDNYRDYYYLPAEDQAVHKDVAAYVDRAFREPAKAENCYIKKSGLFLPETTAAFTPVLRRYYRDPLYWFELPADFRDNKSFLEQYTQILLSSIIKV